jgi:hypothetical protein
MEAIQRIVWAIERESILRATRLARGNQQSLNSHASISESARQSSKGCWTIVNRLRLALGGSASEPDQYNTGRHSRLFGQRRRAQQVTRRDSSVTCDGGLLEAPDGVLPKTPAAPIAALAGLVAKSPGKKPLVGKSRTSSRPSKYRKLREEAIWVRGRVSAISGVARY